MHWPGPSRDLLLRLDVAGIFLVIAGSITPVHVILFDGVERWAPLGVAWLAAIGGMFLRMRYFESLPAGAGTAIFLVFGWCGAVTAFVLWRRYGWKFVRLAIMAGVSYTVGAIVLLLHRPMIIGGVVGPHELWHMAVLAALGMHWRFVFQFAAGNLPSQYITMPLRVPGKVATPVISEKVEPLREVA
jgi:channel protein (hemolysin III family)